MTTSPPSSAEIEAQFADGAPLALPDAQSEWKRLARFLKRPALPPAQLSPGDAARGTGRILILDLALMAVLIAALLSATALGIELPENLNSTLELNLETFILIALVAPIGEEIAFRSWLSGRPGHVLAIAILVAGGAAAAFLIEPQPAIASLAGIAALLGAVIAVAMMRGRPPIGWFSRLFPLFFWLSTIGFALIHLLNYTEGALIVLLLLIVPQFLLGAMLGYVRVHFGLIAAIALHAAHNFLLFSLAAIGGQAGTGAG